MRGGGESPAGTSGDAAARARLIAVARGDAEPDAVIHGARVFSAFTREWLDGDVAIAGGRIAGVGAYAGGERIDTAGGYLVPGLIDAHVHLESSKLTPGQFARAVVPRGTTTVVCDPHEIANVAGVEGVRWLLDAADAAPLDVFVMAPSCVPASAFESPRAPLGPDEMREILRHPRAIGVAEMMNFPGVIAGDPEVLARMVAPHVDGHAPGLTGAALNAYAAAGISSDHEAFTPAEALEKRRAGMWVLIREASNARNLRALLRMVAEHGPGYCAFCTDDREPDFLLREGHIDQMCRLAVAEGIAPEDVLVMATLHGARAHGLRERGAIAPGYRADLVLLEDLRDFRAALVLKDGAPPDFSAAAPPAAMRGTMRCAPVSPTDLAIAGTPERVRVIELEPGQLITGAGAERPALADGRVVADPGRDLAKIAVVERHHGTGRIGLGLVRGFGLRAGAFASTVAHDAHNLVIVGVSDDDMALCAQRAQAMGGGLVVARDGAVRGDLPLPVAGLLSDEPVEAVAERLEHLQNLLREDGVTIDAPFMTLSFLTLSVIPALKITDRGLVDVEAFGLVALALDDASANGGGRPGGASPAGGGIVLSCEAFVARFGALFESSPWVAEAAWRPEGFADRDELFAALRDAMYAAPEDRRLALIRAHPDLGERAAVLSGASRSEQSGAGLDRLSRAEYDRFMTLNAAYRERFRFPFVICVREHTKASILAAADARLGHERGAEIETALGEIAKIARLRLEDAL